MQPEKDLLIPAAELRRLLHVSTSTEWRMRQQSDFPQPVRMNRRIFYRACDVQQFVERLPQDAAR